MATFYDRLFCTNDYLTDGYEMSADYMRPGLILFAWGKMSAAEFKAYVGCTGSGQENDVQDILDTLPVALLTVLNAVNRAAWVERVCAAIYSVRYSIGLASLDTEAEFKTAIGI